MSGYRFIAVEKAGFPIAFLCRKLGVSSSGYYAWCTREPSARSVTDRALTATIGQIHAASRATYGAPRVHAELADAHGIRCGRKRVARLMRRAGLVGVCRRRSVRTTQRDGSGATADDLVQRTFVASAPNRRWVTDITYLPTDEGWLYLAALLDACSRRVVGWAMADHLRTDLVLEALAMALRERRPRSGDLVHHSDRGCQYTAGPYQAVLTAHNIRCSMSRTANCLDNALAESFFATLKRELIPAAGWPSKEAARAAIFEWIAVYYNRQRLHSSLGYRTPVNFERSKGQDQAA